MIAVEYLTIGSRQVGVFLPADYQTDQERRYPVVYVQDAGKLLEMCFNEMAHLTMQGLVSPAIYVGVKPHDRNDEYTPWPAKALFPGQADNKGQARAYIDELADVCKPYIDKRYRTLPAPSSTVTIGGSFGGLVSLLAGLWRPEVFGRLGLLSASLWYEGLLSYLQKHPAPSVERIYMSVGDCEGIYKQSRQADMVPATLAMRDVWRCRGLDEQRLRFVLDRGGTHDAHYMGGNFPKAMQWLLPGPAAAEAAAEAEAGAGNVTETRQRELSSRATGRTYRIMLDVPLQPPPPQGYPVLYVLDGNATFGTFADAMRLLGRKPHGIEPHVIVGIGYPTTGPFAVRERFLDYTDPASTDELPPPRAGQEAWPDNGEADAFSAFIEEELKPLLHSELRLDDQRQILFGHSLGGYFTLRTLFKHPRRFSAYVAASPSIWWKNRVLLQQLDTWRQHLSSREDGPTPALLIGAEADGSKMQRDAEALCQRLAGLSDADAASGSGATDWNVGDTLALRWRLRLYEGETHVSMLYPFMSEIIRFLGQHAASAALVSSKD